MPQEQAPRQVLAATTEREPAATLAPGQEQYRLNTQKQASEKKDVPPNSIQAASALSGQEGADAQENLQKRLACPDMESGQLPSSR